MRATYAGRLPTNDRSRTGGPPFPDAGRRGQTGRYLERKRSVCPPISYRDYSEYGTHPGVGALSLHATSDDGRNWQHSYLETGKRLVAFLFRMLEASAMVENACFECFKDRLHLDAELVRMRSELAQRTDGAAAAVNRILQSK